jgi:Family of unknown function (DUF5989)
LDPQEAYEIPGKLLQPALAMPVPEKKTFEGEAGQKQRGAMAEFLHFALHNKKWWLTPIIVILMLVAALAVLGGTGVAPFIYSLF